MVDGSDLIIILPCSFIGAVLLCILIQCYRNEINKKRENEKFKNIREKLKRIKSTHIAPIEEVKDEYENQIRRQESTV